MKTSIGLKVLATFALLFVMGISLSFGFVFPKSASGNISYWVFKGITLAWLLVIAIMMWFYKGAFSKFFPATVIGIIAQPLPAFIRIGFSVENPAVVIPATYIISFVLFIMLSIAVGLTIAQSKFKKDEDRAGNSSNYTAD